MNLRNATQKNCDKGYLAIVGGSAQELCDDGVNDGMIIQATMRMIKVWMISWELH